MISTFSIHLVCIRDTHQQAYLILIKNLESYRSHDKCWKILTDLGCIFLFEHFLWSALGLWLYDEMYVQFCHLTSDDLLQ